MNRINFFFLHVSQDDILVLPVTVVCAVYGPFTDGDYDDIESNITTIQIPNTHY